LHSGVTLQTPKKEHLKATYYNELIAESFAALLRQTASRARTEHKTSTANTPVSITVEMFDIARFDAVFEQTLEEPLASEVHQESPCLVPLFHALPQSGAVAGKCVVQESVRVLEDIPRETPKRPAGTCEHIQSSNRTEANEVLFCQGRAFGSKESERRVSFAHVNVKLLTRVMVYFQNHSFDPRGETAWQELAAELSRLSEHMMAREDASKNYGLENSMLPRLSRYATKTFLYMGNKLKRKLLRSRVLSGLTRMAGHRR